MGRRKRVHMDGITDPGTLFTISGMVDGVRDTSLRLGKNSIDDPEATQLLGTRYNLLRDAVHGCLDDDMSAKLDMWTGDVGENPTLGTVVAEASLLARFIDMLLAGPAFLVKRRLAQAEMTKISSELDEEGTVPARLLDAVQLDVGGGYGSYL